jgi:thiol-disulfide isomerase/thioredoxin
MNRPRTFNGCLTAVAIIAVAAATAGAQSTSAPRQTQPAADVLPRYRLHVGQKLVYESTATSQAGSAPASYRIETQRTFWVTRRNSDGGWRMVMLDVARQSRMQDGKPAGRPQTAKMLVQFDLHEDGRVLGKALNDQRVNLTTVFPRLPGTRDAAAGWSGPATAGGTTRYKAAPSTQPGAWTFTGVDDGPLSRIYEIRQQTTYVFDLARGLVVHSESRSQQGRGGNAAGLETTRLVSEQSEKPEWVEPFDRQADIYFQATDAYDQAFRDVRPGTQRVEARLADAHAAFQAAAGGVTIPVLAEAIQDRLARHSQSVQAALRNLQERSKMVNKPAADWTAFDFAGRSHSLKDYRGKVVVMDFWFRGCSWCILAMPQLKQLAADFAGKPVAILGMNVDSDPADGQFVIDALELNYTNLRAEGLP